jgi:hypothetical protein
MLDLAAAAVARVLYVAREDYLQHERLLRGVWGYRPIGVAAQEDRRRWVLVRPGIERPLAGSARRLVLVFDLNGVLGAKLFDPAMRWRVPRHCQARCGAIAFRVRPGAAKLLRMCEAAGHEVWIWSTMQRATVEACGRAVAPWLPPGRLLSREDCGEPDAKDLRLVWQRSALQGPDIAARTLLFDDDAAKGRLQPECVRTVPLFAPRDPYDDTGDGGALGMLALIVRALQSQ